MRLLIVLVALISGFAVSSQAEAKCFAFRGQSIRVCIEGHDNSARHAAEDVCESVTGESSCSVSGDSGSRCQSSGSIQCYDSDGDEQRRIELDD